MVSYYYPVNESNPCSPRFAELLGDTGRVMYYCYDQPLA